MSENSVSRPSLWAKLSADVPTSDPFPLSSQNFKTPQNAGRYPELVLARVLAPQGICQGRTSVARVLGSLPSTRSHAASRVERRRAHPSVCVAWHHCAQRVSSDRRGVDPLYELHPQTQPLHQRLTRGHPSRSKLGLRPKSSHSGRLALSPDSRDGGWRACWGWGGLWWHLGS